MKYRLIVNGHPTDGHFADEEQLKAYLLKWKGNDVALFSIEDEFEESLELPVEELVEVLKREYTIVCYNRSMCEMGDDYVHLRLLTK